MAKEYNFNLINLLKLGDKDFRNKFSGTPVKRIGRDRFIRNCCIAAGNSENTKLISTIVTLLLNDKSSLVRSSAVWAVQELADKDFLQALRSKHYEVESDDMVLKEWNI